jgi:glutaredoxin
MKANQGNRAVRAMAWATVWMLVSCLGGSGALGAQAQGEPAGSPDILLFTHVTCPYCTDAKQWVEALQRRRPELTVEVRELTQDRRAAQDLQALARRAGVRAVSVPAWLIGGEVFLVGFGGPAVTGRQIERILGELGRVEEPPPAGTQ